MKAVTVLYLLLALMVTWGHGRKTASPDDCGFSMVNGSISHNCSGTYTTRTYLATEVELCSVGNPKVYTSPVEVFASSCSTILLGYLRLAQPQHSYFFFVLWPILLLSCFLNILLAIWLVFLWRVEKEKGSKLTVTKGGVTISGQSEYRSFGWLQVLALGLLCQSVRTMCVPPVSSYHLGSTSRHSFDLREGEKACFDEGTVLHQKNKQVFEIDHMYDTALWSHFVWSERKCGYGDCGTEEECGKWGEHGKVVSRDNMMYLKICKPHPRNFVVCPRLWGCWLATLEVYWKRGIESLHRVFMVGDSIMQDEYHVSGLDNCRISHINDDPINLRNMILVVDSTGSHLCEQASEVGSPEHGKVGDLQLAHKVDEDSIFDFRAFKCELSEAESSGGCQVQGPGLGKSLEDCVRLPSLMSRGVALWENSSLIVRDSSDRRFDITCDQPVNLKKLNHDCHNLVAETHGIQSSGHLQYLVLSAKSHDSNASVVMESSCGGDSLILPCDGRQYSFEIISEDMTSCYKGLPSIMDKTSKWVEDSYVWDAGNHNHIITSGSLSYLVIAGCLVLACLCFRLLLCR